MTTPFSTIQNPVPPDVMDLGLGDPSLSLLPLDLIREAAQLRLSQDDNSFLQYGSEQGDGHFRLALADFLNKGYNFDVKPEGLFVTNGISNALDLICTLFTKAGDTIFVEEPTYFLALRIFADHHLKIISIDTDANGLIIESLEEKLTELQPKFLYLIPTFHNPTGATMSQERRDGLVELAKEHDFMIVADEVYHLLSYASEARKLPKSFAAYSDLENVISLGSFSKILAPGLRLGWLQAHPERIKRFNTCGLLDSSGGLNPFTSAIVHGIIESGGLENNINKLINIYRSRLDVMNSALHKQLPEVEYIVPDGGYFFWLRFPEITDARELRKTAQAFKVDFRPGTLFSSREAMKNQIRLCFVHYEEAEILEGILRLKACLHSTL